MGKSEGTRQMKVYDATHRDIAKFKAKVGAASSDEAIRILLETFSQATPELRASALARVRVPQEALS